MTPVQVHPSITPAAIRQQLARILGSELFADSQRMARFLQFAVEETLQGRAQQLKENVIGVHVFDRSPSYDPRIDPIVRVEARRLRLKLQAYYQLASQSDELVFEMPKGRYAPLFRMRGSENIREATQSKSIAVLPFANLSPDAETDFLSDGLTEDLISALTRVSNLRVSAWTSAARMKDEQDNLDSIRDRLDVTFVLRGSIRKTRDRIRILAHLIDTSTRQYVWSETFDRKFEDIFSIQDEITSAIVVALRARLNVHNPEFLAETSQNLESYQLCLKGRFHARERTYAGLQRSALCFEQALQIDPDSVSAYAGLADTFTLQAEYGYTDGPSAMRAARNALERALALNPGSAEAHASRGLLLAIYEWSWKDAEAAFRRSLELNSSYAPAHHWYSMNHLAMLGRLDEAEKELEASIQLDPLSPVVREGRGFLCLVRRDYNSAVARYKEVIAGDPSYFKAHTSMGRAYLHMGDHARAIEMLEKGLSIDGEVPTTYGALGQAYGVAGLRSAACDVLEKLRRMASIRPVPSTCFGLVHLGLGDKRTALNWLEASVEKRESQPIGFAVNPAYDQLRGEARFQKLLDRVFPDGVVLP